MNIYIYAIIVAISISSCTNDVAEPLVMCNQPDTVSFSKDIQPIFNKECNDAGCHSGNNAVGQLNLEEDSSFLQLYKPGSGYIDTINPNYSLLYAQMNSNSNPMPPKGKLDKCTIELVLRWIKQKAKNN